MNKQMEELKIKQAVLKAVRKISGVAFNSDLDGYSLSFSVAKQINTISMHLNKGHIDTYCAPFIHCGEKVVFFQVVEPESISEIPAFEVNVEKALSQVFEFVKGDK